MIDRFGKPIRVGWAPHELLYIEAALTFRASERSSAYQDIADMTGRSLIAIRAKAENMASESRFKAAMAVIAHAPLFVSASSLKRSGGV